VSKEGVHQEAHVCLVLSLGSWGAGNLPGGLAAWGDLNPHSGEISPDLCLNSKTGEKSPDWGVHALMLASAPQLESSGFRRLAVEPGYRYLATGGEAFRPGWRRPCRPRGPGSGSGGMPAFVAAGGWGARGSAVRSAPLLSISMTERAVPNRLLGAHTCSGQQGCVSGIGGHSLGFG
jgi:hypothetical protein